MTVLINKTERDIIGIDSFERAVVWSASLLLSAKNSVTVEYDKNFQINLDQETSSVFITLNLPLDMVIYFKSMQNLIKSVKTISDLTVSYTEEALGYTKKLATEPTTVTNLEQYFIWSSQRLQQFYNNNNTDKKSNVVITPNLKTFNCDVSISLGYNIQKYIETNNLLQSVVFFS